ncbi:MAG TPA: hypothetical protein VH762_15420 [Gemmatimonadaceae bacterium]|jgi:hypothetical protein
MDLLLIILRLVHIGLGVFWVGTMVFNAFFLMPSMLEAGPDGMKVAAGLARRRFLDVMPPVAGLTILSGLWLYWKASVGFQPAYMRSSVGMTYGIGSLAALIAFALGIAIMRPSMLKAAALSQAAASAAPEDRTAKLAQAGALRQRGAETGKFIAVLLIIAVATMAVGRYM